MSLSTKVSLRPQRVSLTRASNKPLRASRAAHFKVFSMEAFCLVPTKDREKKNALFLTCPKFAEDIFCSSIDKRMDVHDSMEALSAFFGTNDLELVCQDPKNCLLDTKGLKLKFRGNEGQSKWESEVHTSVYMKAESIAEGSELKVDGHPLSQGDERCLTAGSIVCINGEEYRLERQVLAHA